MWKGEVVGWEGSLTGRLGGGSDRMQKTSFDLIWCKAAEMPRSRP